MWEIHADNVGALSLGAVMSASPQMNTSGAYMAKKYGVSISFKSVDSFAFIEHTVTPTFVGSSPSANCASRVCMSFCVRVTSFCVTTPLLSNVSNSSTSVYSLCPGNSFCNGHGPKSRSLMAPFLRFEAAFGFSPGCTPSVASLGSTNITGRSGSSSSSGRASMRSKSISALAYGGHGSHV